MKSTKRPETTSLFGAPEGWDQDQLTCTGLWVEKAEIEGVPVLCSYWKPTSSELGELLAGGHVRLVIVGGIHPPVAIDAVPAP